MHSKEEEELAKKLTELVVSLGKTLDTVSKVVSKVSSGLIIGLAGICLIGSILRLKGKPKRA